MPLAFWRKPRIPVIQLHGTLASAAGMLNLAGATPAISRAFASVQKGRRHVVLDIDSPGGSPVQSKLIADLIRRRAEETRTRVTAVIQDVGASGGYWLACAADEIVASPLSIVGSIGVVGGGFGFPDLLSRIGVERRLYTSGANKARLDPFSPEKPEDVAFVRQLMGEIHDQFKDWVRTRRAGRLAADEASLFDGSFMIGDRAMATGLVDALGDIETVVRRLGGPKAVPQVYRARRRSGLFSRLRGATETLLAMVEDRQPWFQVR